MSEKKNKVVLRCHDGPCSGLVVSAVKTDVVVEVRGGVAGDATSTVDPGSIEVTLTSLDKSKKLEPNSIAPATQGQLLATFRNVPQGWYRALAVRLGATGKPETSAARNVCVVKIKGTGGEQPQRVTLIMTAQGVAKFVFVDDLDDSPLGGAEVSIRHPDGTTQRHTADGAGQVLVPGGVGEVFSVEEVVHGTSVSITGSQEIS